jgi:hypothetical protein
MIEIRAEVCPWYRVFSREDLTCRPEKLLSIPVLLLKVYIPNLDFCYFVGYWPRQPGFLVVCKNLALVSRLAASVSI